MRAIAGKAAVMSERLASLTLQPVTRAAGVVRLPGSKSITIRALLLAALADGLTTLTGVLDSDDTQRMQDALRLLGVAIERKGDSAIITGAGGALPVKQGNIFVGNSGLTARTITAALALSGGDYVVDGIPRMRERPIGDLVDGLLQAGLRVSYIERPGFPPLRIQPSQAVGEHHVRIKGDTSSQFLTGLLIALPLCGERVVIDVEGDLISKPYVEMTLTMMRRFGVDVVRDGWSRFTIGAGQRYRSPGRYAIEGDASSASYFLAIGALGGGPVRVEGAGKSSMQGDVRFADSLQAMGARVAWGDDWIEASAPANGKLKAIDADFNHIPDAAMTIAVLALFADGASTLRNIGSWRVKETDRIAAMATELAKLGAAVEAGPDYLRVTPPTRWRSAAIETYDDHRVAMCFSLASFGGVPVTILDPGCVAKTVPDYFERYRALVT